MTASSGRRRKRRTPVPAYSSVIDVIAIAPERRLEVTDVATSLAATQPGDGARQDQQGSRARRRGRRRSGLLNVVSRQRVMARWRR